MSIKDIIKIENVSKVYGKAHALNGVTINLKESEEYVIRGASGSGKSTLLYMIGGLDRPSTGTIIVNDNNLNKLSDEDLALYRNKYVGFVFQFHFLLPSMNSLDNMLLPARLCGELNNEIIKRVKDLASLLKVEHCLKKYPYELSGGEQQRINIIRALSLRPKLLLCDEPTGNLDSQNSQVVIKLLRELSREFSSTLIVVTHDNVLAQSFKNQLQMKDGMFLTP
jgi:lipoprotein-releasing system ATP-binding protein